MKLTTYLRELSKAAESYSKSWCRSFTAKLLQTLSARELRDIVYGFIVGQIGVVRILPHDRTQYKLPSDKYGPYIVNPKNGRQTNLIPHFLDWDYVGTQFMLEIYQAFYSRAVFSIDHAYDVGALLGCGVFYIHPVSAPQNFIRHLYVTLGFDAHPEDMNCRLNRNSLSKDRELQARKEDFEQQVEHVSAIREVKHARGFRLHITIVIWHAQSSDKYVEALLPLVYDLKEMGVELNLLQSHIGTRKNEDLTPKYDIPRAEWEENITTNSAFVGKPVDHVTYQV